MNKVKWLWCMTIGVGVVLLYAAPSAYFVDTGEYYQSLTLPDFALSAGWITLGWSVIYLADIAIISRLIYAKKGAYVVAPIAVCGFLNAVWCILFFVVRALEISFFLSVFMTALVLTIGVFLLKEERFSLIFWQLKFVWYSYSCVVMYFICALN